MDDKKIVKIKIDETKLSKQESSDKKLLHTNPILEKFHICNSLSKKMKFKFKDLFR